MTGIIAELQCRGHAAPDLSLITLRRFNNYWLD
jgi:hypothetical protein